MKRAFVVGHPIAHSRSPLIHGYWLREYGIDGSYERIDVAPDDFADFMRMLPGSNFSGGNVTIPHKEMALRLCDRVSDRGKRIGAVNTLVVEDGKLIGDNTDALGFIAHLDESLGPDWLSQANGSVIVLGAGGAARAVVTGLVERGVGEIRVANRSFERAQQLAAGDPERVSVLPWSELPQALENACLLINTTSLGMKDQPTLDINLACLPSKVAVADIVYAPLETQLLKAAKSRGLKTVDGLGMLLHQARPGFEAWFGVCPQVTPALRELIVADLQK